MNKCLEIPANPLWDSKEGQLKSPPTPITPFGSRKYPGRTKINSSTKPLCSLMLMNRSLSKGLNMGLVNRMPYDDCRGLVGQDDIHMSNDNDNYFVTSKDKLMSNIGLRLSSPNYRRNASSLGIFNTNEKMAYKS